MTRARWTGKKERSLERKDETEQNMIPFNDEGALDGEDGEVA